MTRPTLLIFTKAPRIGASKTRLAADIGRTEARRMSRRLTAHTIRQSEHPAWHTRLMVDPPSFASALLGGLWPQRLERRVQQGRSLGDRLANAMDDAPRGAVMFIGTDAPGLRKGMILQASRNLGRNAAVFGPASDGGFWLFGVSHNLRTPSLFKDVRWSSPNAMEDVRRNLPHDTRITLLRQLTDIDTWRDWQLYKQSQ